MKAVLIYLATVGAPLTVLVPLLRAGAGLQAPPSVQGEWRADDGLSGLRLEQSGTFVRLLLPGEGARPRVLRARLRGDSLEAEGAARWPCGRGPSVHIHFGPGPRPTAAAARLEAVGGCGARTVRLHRAPRP